MTEQMDSDTLKRRHLQVVNRFEAETDTDDWLDQARLARHCEHAGMSDRAKELYITAANEAIDAFAVERAVVLFEKGLALYGDSKEADPQVCRTH